VCRKSAGNRAGSPRWGFSSPFDRLRPRRSMGQVSPFHLLSPFSHAFARGKPCRRAAGAPRARPIKGIRTAPTKGTRTDYRKGTRTASHAQPDLANSPAAKPKAPLPSRLPALPSPRCPAVLGLRAASPFLPLLGPYRGTKIPGRSPAKRGPYLLGPSAPGIPK